MLEEGVYLAPSQFEAGFTKSGGWRTPPRKDTKNTVEATKDILRRI